MCSKISWIFLLVCFSTVTGCPPGWLAHGSSCYHFSHDKEHWAEAVLICQILGGHLVEIQDAAENHYVTNQVKLASRDFWIGLNDIQEEGIWVWENSKTGATYTNWASGQPTNYGGNENCVEIRPDLHWNDAPCDTSINFICEKPAGDTEIVG